MPRVYLRGELSKASRAPGMMSHSQLVPSHVMLCVTPLQPSLLFPGPLAFDGLCGPSHLPDFKPIPYITASRYAPPSWTGFMVR
ncbi:hypothetical protein LEMLEM_LOCUS10448, partial [Lemmus lemmus]